MIASVRGTVRVRRAEFVVVECAGIGYHVAVSSETLRAVGAIGQEVFLYTQLLVRDDAMHLYGFATEEERELFVMLTSVQGVGPRVALAVLSGGSPRDLLAAIATGDLARFRQTPGIGKRTAERIIVELREKVSERATEAAPALGSAGDEPRVLAREGLVSLGFSIQEADGLLAASAGATPEELIADALKAAR